MKISRIEDDAIIAADIGECSTILDALVMQWCCSCSFFHESCGCRYKGENNLRCKNIISELAKAVNG